MSVVTTTNFDAKNIVFGEVINFKFGKLIPISYSYSGTETSRFIIQTPKGIRCTKGVTEWIDKYSTPPKMKGYQMTLNLNLTENKDFIKFLNDITTNF